MGDVHIKRSGSWGAIDKCHVKQGGSWQEVQKIHIKRGGSWDEVWQNRTLTTGISPTIFDSDTAGNNVSVGIRFNNDGTYDVTTGGSFGYAGNWITPATSANAQDFEIQVTEAGDSASINVSAADGTTWYDLGTSRTFQDILVVVTETENFTFTIREKANHSNSVSGSFALQTEIFV